MACRFCLLAGHTRFVAGVHDHIRPGAVGPANRVRGAGRRSDPGQRGPPVRSGVVHRRLGHRGHQIQAVETRLR